jgi:peptidoglycan hydrolase-like protein with peptidoglycan-binding domain
VSDPIQPWPVSRNGDEGHPILTLQELLRAHGHQIAVDGVFGPLTEAAVRAVQTSRGITVDGIVGPVTWRALVSGMLSF